MIEVFISSLMREVASEVTSSVFFGPQSLARQLNKTRYFNGKECKRGHLSERKTANASCMECEKLRLDERRKEESYKERRRATTKRWREKNPERNKEISTKSYNKWASSNREKIRQKRKSYQERYPDRISEAGRRYRENNKEAVRNRNKEWRQTDFGRLYSKSYGRLYKAVRLRCERQATPSWLTQEDMQEMRNIHKERVLRQDREGRDYHVDHIVPLKGKTVCGLNVPWNLQIIPAIENVRKSNKLINPIQDQEQELLA